VFGGEGHTRCSTAPDLSNKPPIPLHLFLSPVYPLTLNIFASSQNKWGTRGVGGCCNQASPERADARKRSNSTLPPHLIPRRAEFLFREYQFMVTRVVRKAALLIAITVASSAQADDTSWKAAFAPLPDSAATADYPTTPERVALGRSLYLDTRLSKNNKMSCNSCHNLSTFGVDNEPTSPGHEGKRGGRNSPTSFNAALHVAQFWDGRAKDVEAQALGPILNPGEMGMPSEQQVVDRLKADPKTVEAFKKAFPGEADPLTYQNVGKAIGAFERTLITPSRFDAYLKGDEKALSSAEVDGAKLFVQTGCTACHMGATLGGQMYQKLGLVKEYDTKDLGRFEVTKSEADKKFFKVPSLRNVAKTGPYFHDGSIKTLDQAVSIMAEYQLGKQLTKEQVTSIVTFLGSLTGTPPVTKQ
jgi:cytochrome c peroxidase